MLGESFNKPKPALQCLHMYPLNAMVSWLWSSTHTSVCAPQIGHGPGSGFGWAFFKSRIALSCFLRQSLHTLRGFLVGPSRLGNSLSGLNLPHLVHVCPVVSDFGFSINGTSEVVVLSCFSSAMYQGCRQTVGVEPVAFVLEFVMYEGKLRAADIVSVMVSYYQPSLRDYASRSL